MKTEERDLELYKEHLDLMWGSMVIWSDPGPKNHTFKASEIFEQMNPKAFQVGLREFLLMEAQQHD